MRSAALAACLAALCVAYASRVVAGQAPDVPMGLRPVSATVGEVLERHAHAIGASAERYRVITELWLYSVGDLNGTQKRVTDGDDYREDTVLGPFHEASGSAGGHEWYQDFNGITMAGSGLHRRDAVDREALAHTSSTHGVAALLGVADWAHAYVVRLAPAGGRILYIYYDKDSYLITRIEETIEERQVVTTFEDFRTINGATSPWHVHESDGRPYNERDWHLQELDYTKSIAPATFSQPASDTSHLELRAPRVQLPAKIIADRVILTANMGIHTVDFQLDSGASGILLDKSVADALALPSYGKQTETTAGTYTSTRSVAPAISFGQVILKNVALTTAPFNQWEDESTPVAGLLGFDFLAGCVVHIDYQSGKVEALDASTFQAPPGGNAIPVRLDDGVPAIAVTIGDTVSNRFIVDTGADRSVLFSSFVTAHPRSAADQGLGTEYTEAFPFYDEVSGVGGQVKVTHTQVPSLTIGSTVFPRWLFSVIVHAPSFEGEDYDGLIGQDVLRYFDVYLDYPHLKIYLVPNERYRQRYA